MNFTKLIVTNVNNKRSLKLKIMMEYIQAKAYLDKKKKAKERKLRLFGAIGRFFCKVGLHNWKFSHDTGINEYYECKRCKNRKVDHAFIDGYQPIDRDWLNAL